VWGIFLSRVEIESFLKSFLLFFVSLGVLISSLFYLNYTKEIQTLDEKLFSQMRACSYDLRCEEFSIDFVAHNKENFYTLYKDANLSSYYPIPNSEIFMMSITLSEKNYNLKLQKLQNEALINLSIFLAIVFVLSIIFSFYALYPLRNALLLTQEFIKDILHDFNTPIATLRLNSSMLKHEIGKNKKIDRIEMSVENILKLQTHLRSYLQNDTTQMEQFSLEELVQNHIELLQKSYPDIQFTSTIQNITLRSNKESLSRIIQNLLTNSAKYNKKNGSVSVEFDSEKKYLYIIDTGLGIKNTKKVFDRFYKEQERGIGIGLHIVKKLSQELGIKIVLKSEVGNGSSFRLDLNRLTLN